MDININKTQLLFIEDQDDDDDEEGPRIVINVGGVKFETYVATLQNISDTRLAWLTENADPQQKMLFFDRHPGAFVYILNFYRTGKLHIPTDMCGPAFEEELKFWGIDEKQMEPCCWGSFTRHREAEENLRTFEGPGFEDLHKSSSPFTPRLPGVDNYSQKVWKILDDPHSSKYAKVFSLVSCFMIILSVSGYCLGTMPSMLGNKLLLDDINYVCVVFFTIECIGRLATTPNRKQFMCDYNNWIDFISVAPSYLVLMSSNNWVKNLVIIRLLRVFKFFKLSYGLQVLVHTLKASSYELTLLFLMLLIPLVIFSSLVYAVESNLNEGSKFISIPATFWWCLITMTTVGYGDITPVTWAGQMIGAVCAIFGLLTVALPISVIGGNFSLYYAHVKARLRLPRKNRNLLQVNMHGLLRQTDRLSSRDRCRTKAIKRDMNSNVSLTPVTAKKLKDRRQCFENLLNDSNDEDSPITTKFIPDNFQKGNRNKTAALMQMKSVHITSENMLPNGLLQSIGNTQEFNNHCLDEDSSFSEDEFDETSFDQCEVINNRSKRSLKHITEKACEFISSNGDLGREEDLNQNIIENDIVENPEIMSPLTGESLCYVAEKINTTTEIDNNIEDILNMEFDTDKCTSRPLIGKVEKFRTLSKSLDENKIISMSAINKDTSTALRRESMKQLGECERTMKIKDGNLYNKAYEHPLSDEDIHLRPERNLEGRNNQNITLLHPDNGYQQRNEHLTAVERLRSISLIKEEFENEDDLNLDRTSPIINKDKLSVVGRKLSKESMV